MNREITIDDITPFCAGCGCGIENDTWGLCDECEENIQNSGTGWTKKEEKENTNEH